MLLRPTHSRIIMPAAITGRDSTVRFGRLAQPRREVDFLQSRRRGSAGNMRPAIPNPCGCGASLPSLEPILSRSRVMIMLGTSSWQLREGEQIIACNGSLLGRRHFLIGITRVRNEALILRDTLDYVGKHVDAIVAYDDASTDRTLEILGGHPKVALIVTNRLWEADIEARRMSA
jgi:hypothetical protein